MLVIRALVRSSFGRSLKAIRDDETAAWASARTWRCIKTHGRGGVVGVRGGRGLAVSRSI